MQVFAPDTKDPQIAPLLKQLQSARDKYQKSDFRAFAIFWNEKPENLTKVNKDLKIDGVALATLPGAGDPALKDYSVDPKNKTTVIVYKNRKVTASFVNYDAKKDSAKLEQALEAVGR